MMLGVAGCGEEARDEAQAVAVGYVDIDVVALMLWVHQVCDTGSGISGRY